MKLRIAIIAVIIFVAAGLYLHLRQSPVEKGQPLFHKSEESVVPNDSNNSDPSESPTPQKPSPPDRNPSAHLHTTVVVLQKHLPTADS